MPKNNLNESDVEAIVFGEEEADKLRLEKRTAMAITHVFDCDFRQGHGFKEIKLDKNE